MSGTELKDRESAGSGVYDDSGITPSGPHAKGVGSDEAKKLNDSFYSPSAKNENMPDGHPDKKTEGSDGGTENSGGASKKKKKGKRFGGLQKKMIGGGVFGIFAIGGLGGTLLVSNSFQMIHFSQLIQNKHFSLNEMVGRSRVGKLLRYNTSSPERRNMTFLGNQIADRYQSKLRANGFELNFTGEDGRGRRTLQSISIDSTTPEARSHIRNLHANGVDVSGLYRGDGSGIIDIPVDKSRDGRRSIRAMVATLNLNGVSGALTARVLNIRANVSFKPMTNTTREAGESLRAFFSTRNEADAERRRTGASSQNIQVAGQDTGTAEEPNISQEASQNSQDLQQANAGNDLESTRQSVRQASESFSRGAARGAGAAGLVCLVKGVYAARDMIMYANIILPLMRIGVDYIAVGDQNRAMHDFNIEELSRFHRNMYDIVNRTHAFSADEVRDANNKPPVGNTIPDYAHPGRVGDRPAAVQLIDEIPGIDAVCTTVAGQLLLTVAGGLTDLVVEGALLALRQAGIDPVEYLVESVARRMAGEEVEGNPTGALLGSLAMHGGRLASDDALASVGGRELSPAEQAEVEITQREMLLAERKAKPWQKRMFDLYDVDSMASRVAMQSYENFGSYDLTVRYVAMLPLNVFKMIGSMLSGPAVYARDVSESYDYGYPRFGFSMRELEGMDDSFDPLENADFLEDNEGALLREMNDEYGECFNTIVDPDTGRVITTDSVDLTNLDDKCSQRNNTNLLRYRLYLLDTVTVKALACFEMIDTDSCREIGVN